MDCSKTFYIDFFLSKQQQYMDFAHCWPYLPFQSVGKTSNEFARAKINQCRTLQRAHFYMCLKIKVCQWSYLNTISTIFNPYFLNSFASLVMDVLALPPIFTDIVNDLLRSRHHTRNVPIEILHLLILWQYDHPAIQQTSHYLAGCWQLSF